MTSKHTPGPADLQEQVCIMHPSTFDGVKDKMSRGGDLIGTADSHKGFVSTISVAPDTAAERDRLKAANAELLACLIVLLKAFDENGLEMNSPEIDPGDPEIPPHPWHIEWISKARAAIAKASARDEDENQI